MINDIKLGFKMLQYSMQYVQSLVVFAIFIFLAVAMDLFPMPFNSYSGIYYLFGMVLGVQLIHMLGASNMIQTSPYKKRFQTSVVALMSLCLELIFVTIMIMFKVVHYFAFDYMKESVCNMLVCTSIVIIILNLYMTIAMKYFWIGTILFIVAFWGIHIRFMRINIMLPDAERVQLVSLPTGILMCYIAIFVGSVFMYWIGNLLYKKEYSKMAFRHALKQGK